MGKSDKGKKTRDTKVRIGQHLTPNDKGGDLRRNWCRQNCSHGGCEDKFRCLGPEFRSYEGRMLRCDVWTTIWPSAAIDTETATRAEDLLIRLAEPTYQKQRSKESFADLVEIVETESDSPRQPARILHHRCQERKNVAYRRTSGELPFVQQF